MISISQIQVLISQLILCIDSEYPTVDGHLSINVYLNALARCYETLRFKH